MQGTQSKHLKIENQASLWNNFKSFALSYVYYTILFWFCAVSMKNYHGLFSLVDSFTVEKVLLKNILGIFYLLTNFQNICDTF